MKRRMFLQAMAMVTTGEVAKRNELAWGEGARIFDKSFKVVGDGVTNDRFALQKAIDAAVGKILVITGNSRIDDVGLSLRSGSNLYFAPGASLKLLPYMRANHQMLRIWDVTDVLIENATLDGSRELSSAENKKNSEGYGMGISISGSSNIKVINPVTNGCWGDGIYIANSYSTPGKISENIHVISHRAINCRRQGVSIVSGINIRFDDPVWENIGGTLPSAGLDIEPNSYGDMLDNIRINNPISRECKIGIQIWLAALSGKLPKKIDVKIANHQDVYSSDGAYHVRGLVSPNDDIFGEIVTVNPKWISKRKVTSWVDGIIPRKLAVGRIG